jgi:hypothetical protein
VSRRLVKRNRQRVRPLPRLDVFEVLHLTTVPWPLSTTRTIPARPPPCSRISNLRVGLRPGSGRTGRSRHVESKAALTPRILDAECAMLVSLPVCGTRALASTHEPHLTTET